MKFCPKCNNTFSGSETFCPHDGTRLEEPRRGELLGATLGNAVKLETLEFTDVMGERYIGRLTEGKRPCYVTVFNQKFSPSQNAPRLVETARAKVGTPVPRQLSSLLQVRFDHFPAYVIETAPRGPSLRALLNERKRLDWKDAVRIATNVARVIEWLTQHGVTHHSLHPGSIYVTDLAKGYVQLGEWYSEDAQWVDNPLQTLATTPERFVGYVAYMAPELAFHARGADLRSAVYALGILLYELVVGKPPFAGANPSDVLRQQLTEIPPRLSVARGDGSINEDLDQIVEMMLAKAPDSRFQAPAAIIGALSSLLGSSPMELAPPIERDEEQEENDHYSTIEMSSVDRDSIPGLALPERNMQTILTPAAINQKRVDEEEAGDDSGPMKTLMMGSAAAVPDEGFSRTTSGSGIFKVVKIGKVEEIVDMSQDVGPTRPTNPLPMGTEEEPLEEPDAKQVEVSPVVEDQARPDSVAEVVTQAEAKLDDEVVAPAATTETAPEEERVAEAAVPAAAETPSVEVSMEAEKEKEEKSPKREEKTSKKDKRDKKTSSKPVVALSKEDTATAKKGPSEIGSIAAKNPDTDTDNWFAATSDNAWNDSMAVDLAEEVETKNQKVLWGIGIALILGALGFIIWTQFIYEAEEPVKDPVEEVAKQPAVDVGELAQKFDEAMREGRIISPIGNSAMARLEEMKRHAPDGPEFAKARGEFVKRSREEAVAAFEAENVGLARNYAGYASQFAPEDTELKALAERYQAEFVKTIEVPSFDRDPNAIPEADAGNEQARDVEPVIETPPVVEEKPVEKVEKPVEKVAKPIEKVEKPKDSPKLNLKTMSDTDSKANTEKLSEARAAYSRGDLSRAQNLYLELVKSDAGNHQVHAGLGQVYFDRALYNDAVKHQQQALKLKPGRADYQINLGQSYYRLGRFQDAINVWEEVLKKDPNNKNAKQYIELAKRRLN